MLSRRPDFPTTAGLDSVFIIIESGSEPSKSTLTPPLKGSEMLNGSVKVVFGADFDDVGVAALFFSTFFTSVT